MQREPLTPYPLTFDAGYFHPLNPLSAPRGSYGPGSRNQSIVGDGEGARPWKGLATKGASSGSRIMCQVGNTYGGIKDIGGTQGSGSLFQDIGKSLWSIGAGQVSIEGTNVTGFTLSSTLKVCLLVSGSYTAAGSGPYSSGMSAPSSPDVGIIGTPGGGHTGTITGPVSVKIARLRNSTGARSVASTTSAVLVLQTGQTVRVTFPAASAGQDNWAAFFTQQGFGGVGLHYRLAYNGALDIPESVIAASTVDGVARSLEFDYKDGDLVPELAYIDDYPPPAGTHAVRLENVMCVLGAYPDAVSGPSSTNPGTAGAISLPNFYESYKPRNLVYFPEPVVSVLNRLTDSYAYVACRNSVLTLQYVGLQDGPACTVSVAWPDVGIAKPHNWCQAFGRIFAWIENGGLVRMTEDGGIDYEWSAPVKEFTKDWDTSTVVGFNPATLSIVAANGAQSVGFCLQNGKWSTPHYFADAGVTGNALSCTTSRGELVMSVDNAGTHTAYRYDSGASSMTVTAMSAQVGSGGRPRTLMELDIAFETDNANPAIVSVHKNMRKAFARDGSVTNANNVLTSASFAFNSSHTGDLACVFGTNVGGVGVNYLIARLTYASATTVQMTNPDTGAALNAQATLTNCYILVGAHVKAQAVSRAGQQFFPSLRNVLVREMLSYSIGITLMTSATAGQVDEIVPYGTAQRLPVLAAA